jgi:hypothetical protein
MANDQLVIGGTVGNNAVPYSADYGVARLNADGSLDSTFGDNGKAITDLGMSDYIFGMYLQQNNKIVAIGESDTLGAFYCSVARYNNDATKKQIIITKIKRWLQHHNGIEWDNTNNVRNYVVQRSYDGIHFSSIARININNQSNLTYQDPTPLSGNNYYRLQTTSINGAVNYSNVIAVTNDNIKLSPNPATNSLHIQGLPSSSNIQIAVVDLAGNVALSIQLSALSTSYNLNIASLKQGNYLLKIETKDDVATKQFVKE